MKRNLIRRLVSTILIVAILFTLAISPGFASGENNDKFDTYRLILENNGFEINDFDNKVLADNHIAYTSPLGNEGIATITNTLNGNTLFKFEEGSLSNTVLITNKGEVYLDGNLVTVEEKIIDFQGDAEEGNVMPRANRYEFVDTCPYGSSSDYGNYTMIEKNLDWHQEVISISDAALATTFGVVAGLGGIVYGAVASYGISRWIGKLRANDPFATSASFRDKRSVHSTLGFNVTSNMSVAKHVFQFYYEEDCRNPILEDDGTYFTVSGYEVFTY